MMQLSKERTIYSTVQLHFSLTWHKLMDWSGHRNGLFSMHEAENCSVFLFLPALTPPKQQKTTAITTKKNHTNKTNQTKSLKQSWLLAFWNKIRAPEKFKRMLILIGQRKTWADFSGTSHSQSTDRQMMISASYLKLSTDLLTVGAVDNFCLSSFICQLLRKEVYTKNVCMFVLSC